MKGDDTKKKVIIGVIIAVVIVIIAVVAIKISKNENNENNNVSNHIEDEPDIEIDMGENVVGNETFPYEE